jgi:hypothetical protein
MSNRNTHHRSPAAELHHLEQVADEGESNETPLIVAGAAFVVYGIAFLVILALAMLAYTLG